ncbi:MAG: AbrB/MazE/SpoVT family DNA-binding domain-containing protein [Ignavibacteria bacterium]
MHTVTMSSKFQIIIPKEIREKFDLRPGDKLQVLGYENRIELFIVKDIKKPRGFLNGMDTDIGREDRDFTDLPGVKFIKK